MSKPFSGVRVLDFTQVFAGPFGSFQLALLGADVIKIEKPGGEDMRRAPPFDHFAEAGYSTHWLAINANKRSLELDLKQPEAVAAIHRLVADADVVMENFRPGVMDRLGLGWEALSALNPKLIYCSLSGFGHSGPEKEAPGYDGKIQAMSGIMSITGHPGTGPTRAGFAVCDALSGMTAAFAVAGALFQRTHTGKGQRIDLAMLDASLTFLSPNLVEWMVGGHRSEQFGNQAISRRPTANLFAVRDGHLLLAVNTEKQYQALLAALGLEVLNDDPRFADWQARSANEAALREKLEAALATEDARTWDRRLNDAGAPCASIWRLDEVADNPQLAHRDVLQEVDSPMGRLKLVGSGFRLAHGGGSVETPPPLLGEHSEAVLREAGFSDEEIEALRPRAGS